MKLDAEKIRKEVEDEVYELLQTTHYGNGKLLEAIENTAKLVLIQYGIEDADVEANFSTGGNISITGIETSVKKYNDG